MQSTRYMAAAQILLLALAYLAAAKAGLLLAFVHDSVTTVWPAAGIALAAVLHFGWRILPGVTLGAFGANLLFTGAPAATAFGIALGNTLEAVTGVLLLQLIPGFRTSLPRLRDLLILLLVCAPISSTTSATIGTLSLYLSDLLPLERYWQVWSVWLVGDATGIAIVTPMLLVWLARPLPSYSRANWLELSALALVLGVLAAYVLPGHFDSGGLLLPFAQLLFPPMIWLAIRFGLRETTAALLIVSALAVWQTASGLGPFARDSLLESIIYLHGFIVILSLTSLPLAAINEERRQALERLRLASNAIESTADGIMITDRDNRIVSVNRAFSHITGYSAEEVLGRPPDFLRSGQYDPEFYQRMWRELTTTGYWQGETWNRRKDGASYPEWLTINAVKNGHPTPTHYVAVFTDISQRLKSEQRLNFLAHHDALTQLANRTLFHEWLQETLLRAHRHGSKTALLFIDLDHFKPINDSLGHLAGDHLLQETARRIQACVRESDMTARLGGDEFTVLLDDIEQFEDAAVTAGKVLAALTLPFDIAGNTLYITASIGIACYPRDGLDAQTLLRNADAAMYQAKGKGRNNFQFYRAE